MQQLKTTRVEHQKVSTCPSKCQTRAEVSGSDKRTSLLQHGSKRFTVWKPQLN